MSISTNCKQHRVCSTSMGENRGTTVNYEVLSNIVATCLDKKASKVCLIKALFYCLFVCYTIILIENGWKLLCLQNLPKQRCKFLISQVSSNCCLQYCSGVCEVLIISFEAFVSQSVKFRFFYFILFSVEFTYTIFKNITFIQ